jgi:PPOX class probable F420-dependent enzyme
MEDAIQIDPEAEKRLDEETVIWLTTVNPKGQPQTSPVWFVWNGKTFLIYSIPKSPKVPNIQGNPHVSLNLDGDGKGGGIVSIEGRATVDGEASPLREVKAYVDKYLELLLGMNTEVEPFSQLYSTAIRVTPTRSRYYR